MTTEESDNKNKNYVFPKWTNYLPTVILASLLVLGSIVVFVLWYWGSPKNYEIGYAPTQPINYSHQLHAGQLGIDCRYCHYNVERSSHATTPATDVCLNCHEVIKTDSPEIQKLHQSKKENKSIEWVKVHYLPDYVYFNHSAHVNAGVACQSCHGRVDQMEVVRVEEPLSMSRCLECHRNPDKNIRPKELVTKMGLNIPDPESLGKIIRSHHNISPREDCSTCHR